MGVITPASYQRRGPTNNIMTMSYGYDPIPKHNNICLGTIFQETSRGVKPAQLLVESAQADVQVYMDVYAHNQNKWWVLLKIIKTLDEIHPANNHH